MPKIRAIICGIIPSPLRGRGFFISLFLLLSSPALAALDDTRAQLEKTEQELNASRKKAEKLERELGEVRRDMERMSRDVTRIAADLQKGEKELSGFEETLRGLEKEREKKKKTAAKQQAQLEGATSAMIRLAQAPDGSALALPGKFLDKARAAQTLAMLSQTIRAQAEALNHELADLRALEQVIAGKRDEIETKNKVLAEKRTSLDDLLARRKQAMEEIYAASAGEKKRIERLVTDSRSLASLLASLEEEHSRQEDTRYNHIGVPVSKPVERPAVKTARNSGKNSRPLTKGALRLPAEGTIIHKFGESRGSNDTLKGIEIRARAGGRIIAPHEGEVLFTGPFLNYGKMVILRHSNRHHTLLAGFSRVDCVPGQFLLEGEPIGVMGNAEVERTLYMELREQGKPVDPAPWIARYRTYLASK